MNIINKTVLITGGGTGIGLAIAKKLSATGNEVILVGRREDKLKSAVHQLNKASYIVADIANEAAIDTIAKKLTRLDLLVNNAGVIGAQPLLSADGLYESAKYEMDINYLSVVRLTERLLPLLKQSQEAAIVNVASVLSYLPSINFGTYSASKAALHSYSQALRLVLQKNHPNIKLFEVFPPYVDTDMTAGIEATKLSPDEIADDLYNALQKEEYAIRNGITKDVYNLFHQQPETAVLKFNGV